MDTIFWYCPHCKTYMLWKWEAESSEGPITMICDKCASQIKGELIKLRKNLLAFKEIK